MTEAVELHVLEGGAFEVVGELDWLTMLLDAADVTPLGELADESSVWDVYEATDRGGVIHTYALQVWADPGGMGDER